ncbi:molybdenum cofactor guanylyltransferase [Gelidibacter salicanalis]|uniref:Probable molybdenum cofactor guanylyltransferase n=1 Tax=Gelidibacter salicanalis TaxID=291193 RepID=A0A934NH51_9FLAO|nr:molybdenum cofactor guanylyltransferase [Gelidibacter salicanalis]MBJ7880411.1 molybdenum cofactor guanylyltransferase [Gelidibacter salicanalis]
MLETVNITGIILAGGKSSRMGMDKGFILWEGKPFVNHIIDALKPLAKDILIVSDHPQYDTLGYKRIKDILPEAGPLAGLYSGLSASKTELNVVLSCDVPLITSELLRALLLSYNKENDAVVCKVNDKLMPLVAIYTKKCEVMCLELLQQDERRMMQLIKKLNQVQFLSLNEFEANQVKNINSPTELKQI